MSDQVYHDLAKVLDTLPNGFPSTESGVEIKLLKKVFEPDEAELFCDLRLTFETAEQISKRTGRAVEGLEDKLASMGDRGQLFAIDFGAVKVFRMMPWVFGIYEFQLNRIDREFCELNEQYHHTFGKQFFAGQPQFMQVLPVEKDISAEHQSLAYEQVSNLIDSSQSFAIQECICKKEKAIMDEKCDRTLEVCMALAPVPGIFDNFDRGEVITRERAYEILEQAEKEALVHLTWNTQSGNFFICNCCGCCCGVLRGITEMGIPAGKVVNTHFVAKIDADSCISCGICADERCQVNAIEEGDDAYEVVADKCIGCGLCISTCSEEAITLVRKDDQDCVEPPENEDAWYEERARIRGRDFSKFK